MSKKKSFEHEIDPELLAEIEEWEQQEHDEPEGYFFSNPDPYLKPAPLPPDHPKHNFWFDEGGHICVKNPSAFWLPEFTLQKEIGGTVYTVTGSYDGVETLDRKMERMRQLPKQHGKLFSALYPGCCSGRFGLDAHESGHLLCDTV